jgi:hypothetical protein
MMALLTAGIMVSFATSGIFRLITTSLASKGALKGLQNHNSSSKQSHHSELDIALF